MAQDLGIRKTTQVASWAMTGLAIVAVSMRLMARFLKKDMGLGEVAIVLSMCIGIVFNSIISVATQNGVGAHVWTLSKQLESDSTKWAAISNAVAVHSISWPKLAVMVLIQKRLLPSRSILITFYGTAALLIGCSCCCTIIFFAQCSPTAKLWDTSLRGSCLPPNVITDVGILTGSLSACLDFCYASYSAAVIWGLQMSRGRRTLYSSIMSLGVVAGSIGIYKCTKLPALNDPPDPSYLNCELILWTSIESSAIIIGASIPTILPLLCLLKDKVAAPVSRDNLFKHSSSSQTSYFPSMTRLRHILSATRSRSRHVRIPGEGDLGELERRLPLDKASEKAMRCKRCRGMTKDSDTVSNSFGSTVRGLSSPETPEYWYRTKNGGGVDIELGDRAPQRSCAEAFSSFVPRDVGEGKSWAEQPRTAVNKGDKAVPGLAENHILRNVDITITGDKIAE